MSVAQIPEHQRPLRELLSSLSDRRFLFVRSGGNWGDQLIYRGADFLASHLGLQTRTLYYEQFIKDGANPGEVIYLHGGGGFTHMASGKAPGCLRKALQSSGSLVIQGPCTLSDDSHGLQPLHAELWSMQADRLLFFTRDRESARLAASDLPPSVEHFLNEDTAFYLDRETLLKWAGPTRHRLDLVAVREDSEAIAVSESQPGSAAVIDPAYFARSFDHWLRIHAASRTIITNRTHSAVCGAILGVPTTLFPGAYHKNRSIWEFSLEARGVKWRAEPVAGKPDVDPLLSWIPVPAIRRSWKLDRLAKGLRGIPLS